MLRDDAIYCDSCGQKLPLSAKLAQQTLTEPEARGWGSVTAADPDGTVTVDICLACRIARGRGR